MVKHKEKTMDQTAIFWPFLSMMLLTLIVWVYMYARRIPFIREYMRKGNLTPEQITLGELSRISPPTVSNPSDNLKNLFEIPTLFYGLALYLFVTHQVDTIYLVAAWIFVAFRVLHSAVHCTINIVWFRFWLYFISTMAVWFMAIRSFFGVLA
jgi:hypothetical protein